MRFFVILTVLICIAFPGFSQSANQERFKALSTSMERTVTSSHDKLENFNDLVAEDGKTKNFTAYQRKYQTLSKALNESEAKLNFLIRTNDRASRIKAERDNYERLVKQMEDLKAEYDDWMNKSG